MVFDMIEKVFPADIDKLPEASEFVLGELEAADASMKAIMQVEVAFEEVFVNVAHYSYENGEGTVKVCVDITDGTAEITLIDSGMQFNPLDKPDPDITASADERDIGGLGIYMVKKTMDDVQYEYRDSQNVLKLFKKI